MERICPDSETAEMIPYQLDAPYLLFPVRHHSPVCSFHLLKTIAAYNPDLILIEGPENANDLLPALTDENTVLPAAIYYFYKDAKKLVSAEAEDYKCYYPFLYSSPELRALAEAKRRGIPAKFVDLPYSEILIATANGKGLRKDADKHSYADDSDLARGRFLQTLCEKTGLRSFEEFWEKYFEIRGLHLETEAFLRQLHTYCILTRQDASQEELKADGTLAREQHMAFRIREAMASYQRILVVTGGFHSIGIDRLLQSASLSPVKLHTFPPNTHGCYPMAYSYEAADALHGYASGMNYPHFYDCIMQRLLAEEPPQQVYTEETRALLVQTAKASAQKDVAVSISEISAAFSMMQGLAALRNTPQCGITELFDGITGTFIKGEKTISSSLPLELLAKSATGTVIGKIGLKTHIPPLIADYERQCERLGLHCTSALPKEIELSLFGSAKGMEQSRFFHRMNFLETQFAIMRKGPDLYSHKDRNRVREAWRYKRTPHLDAALIDHTTDGFSIEEACSVCASRSLREEQTCAAAARIAVDCFRMGLPMTPSDTAQMEAILSNDGDFFSLGEGIASFEILCHMQSLYEMTDEHPMQYLKRCFEKLLILLPSMANISEDNADACTNVIRTMNGIASRILPDALPLLEQALLTLTEAPDKEPVVYGTAIGILYAMQPSRSTDAERIMQGYLRGTVEMQKKGAKFLMGLFHSARDILFADGQFLRMTDALLTQLSYDDFMEILPSLRLAFSRFTPHEIQMIGENAAAIHQTNKTALFDAAEINEALYAFGKELDSAVCRQLGKEALLHA